VPLRHVPPDTGDCGYRNSLQNEVNSITSCITLNANTGKIVLVILCIQIEWLFYRAFGVKLSHESGADSIGHGDTCPTVTNDWARGGAPTVEEQKTESDQTLLTITNALTKTTN